MTTVSIPRAFVWRRLHSLMGLWLVLFLMEHLLVNSQAALLLGDNGQGFVNLVNSIHNLPYLQVVELVLLGVPFAIHLFWGVKYLFTAKANASKGDGSRPGLPEYRRNRAYSWQRITSWILLIGVIAHVVKFRYMEYPLSLNQGTETAFFVRVHMDNGLYTVADRLGAKLYDETAIAKEEKGLQRRRSEKTLIEEAKRLQDQDIEAPYDTEKDTVFSAAQKYEERARWVEMLERRSISGNEVIAVTNNFGVASLLTVRDTFKSPVYGALYTIFVLAACFHAFNGLWTFLITWGVILKMTAQRTMASFAVGLMLLVAFLGLAAIWGTYFLNLKS